MNNTLAIIYVGEKKIYDDLKHHYKLFDLLDEYKINYKIYTHFKRNNKWPNNRGGNWCNQTENIYDAIENIDERYILKLRLDLWFCESSYKILVENIKELLNNKKNWISLGQPCDSMLETLKAFKGEFKYEESFKIKFVNDSRIIVKKKHEYGFMPINPSKKDILCANGANGTINDTVILFDKNFILPKEKKDELFTRILNSDLSNFDGNYFANLITLSDVVHYDVYCNIVVCRKKVKNDGEAFWECIPDNKRNRWPYAKYYKEHMDRNESL